MNEKTCYCILKCVELTNACAIGVQESLKAATKLAKKHNRLVAFTVIGLGVTTLAIKEINAKIDILTKELEELKRMEGE